MSHPRIANWVDRFHSLIVVFWLGGFAFYWHFPAFRHFHAWFVVVAGVHQALLGNRCILTIVSDKLRGPKPEAQDEPAFIADALKRLGIRWTDSMTTVVVALTFVSAIITLIFW